MINPLLKATVRRYSNADHGPGDPIIIENVWKLAQQDSNIEIMLDILKISEVPAGVLSLAKAHRNPDVRVAYLARRDCSQATREELLDKERRSEVFAGLVGRANDNVELATILAARLVVKPTKLLATAMLRGGFQDKKSMLNCIKLIANSDTMPEPVKHLIFAAIREVATTPVVVKELIGCLHETFLHSMPIELCDEADLTAIIDKMIAVNPEVATPHQINNGSRCAETLRKIAIQLTLPSKVAQVLKVRVAAQKSRAASYQYFESLADILAGREVVILDGTLESLKAVATNARGGDIEHVCVAALSYEWAEANELIAGLLENKEAYSNPLFEKVIRQAHIHMQAAPNMLADAVKRTDNVELFKAIWNTLKAGTPSACCEAFTGTEEVVLELATKAIETKQSNDTLMALLAMCTTESMILMLPWTFYVQGHTRYWQNNAYRNNTALDVAEDKIAELQKRFLGSDYNKWETYNRLSNNWSGSFGTLLETASSI
jgi:hypothetical protein